MPKNEYDEILEEVKEVKEETAGPRGRQELPGWETSSIPEPIRKAAREARARLRKLRGIGYVTLEDVEDLFRPLLDALAGDDKP